MDSKTKRLLEMSKGMDSGNTDCDPFAEYVIGSVEMSTALRERDDEPIQPAPRLSRAEQNQIDRELDGEANYYRLYGTFSSEFEREISRLKLTPHGEGMLEQIEEEKAKRLGLAPVRKAQDPLDALVDKFVEGFIASGGAERAFSAAVSRLRGGSGPKEKLRRAVERAEAEAMFEGIVNSRTVEYIKAYCAGHVPTMRKIARELAGA